MKRYRLKRWARLTLILILIIVILPVLIHKKEKATMKEYKVKQEKIQLEIAQAEYEEPVVEETSYTTRMTSYYTNDGYGTSNITASGLTTNNFEINENGWYTYNGKLVIATASTRLGYTEMRTYNLYDEITLNIDGIEYEGIVVDVCGACQRHNRIDLFVSNANSVKDTIISVKE